MKIKPDFYVSKNEVEKQIQTIKRNIHTGQVIGASCCAMGSIALMVAIVNACKSNYDWAILTSASGAFSVCIGIQNLKIAHQTRRHLNELQQQLHRLKSFYKGCSIEI